MTEPNLKDWAEALVHGITREDTYNDKLVEWVKSELEDIADKFYLMGFHDGDKDGWHTALEQDVEQQRRWKAQEDDWRVL